VKYHKNLIGNKNREILFAPLRVYPSVWEIGMGMEMELKMKMKMIPCGCLPVLPALVDKGN